MKTGSPLWWLLQEPKGRTSSALDRERGVDLNLLKIESKVLICRELSSSPITESLNAMDRELDGSGF